MSGKQIKAGGSLEKNRKKLLSQLKACASSGVVERSIPFQNEDVPTFLVRLKEFERKSREADLVVG